VEALFAAIFDLSGRVPFPVRIFEAPHFARYVLQAALKARDELLASEAPGGVLEAEIAPSEVLFISHTGEVSVSPFAPAAAGNVRYQPLSWVYRSSDLMAALRDPENLKGKCGRCEYRAICRGSRARAYAVTGDLFAADPLCAYQPGAFAPAVAHAAMTTPMPEV
jgi:radical SAM protein with 4Fe4S-binding SPASM domain